MFISSRIRPPSAHLSCHDEATSFFLHRQASLIAMEITKNILIILLIIGAAGESAAEGAGQQL